MLQAMEFKKMIKLKLGMVPALLALLSENPCTFIVCLTIHVAEQQEINEAEFRQFLECIPPLHLFSFLHLAFSPLFFLSSSVECSLMSQDVSNPKRDFPLQPSMLFDFLQNEIGIDVRVVSLLVFL